MYKSRNEALPKEPTSKAINLLDSSPDIFSCPTAQIVKRAVLQETAAGKDFGESSFSLKYIYEAVHTLYHLKTGKYLPFFGKKPDKKYISDLLLYLDPNDEMKLRRSISVAEVMAASAGNQPVPDEEGLLAGCNLSLHAISLQRSMDMGASPSEFNAKMVYKLLSSIIKYLIKYGYETAEIDNDLALLLVKLQTASTDIKKLTSKALVTNSAREGRVMERIGSEPVREPTATTGRKERIEIPTLGETEYNLRLGEANRRVMRDSERVDAVNNLFPDDPNRRGPSQVIPREDFLETDEFPMDESTVAQFYKRIFAKFTQLQVDVPVKKCGDSGASPISIGPEYQAIGMVYPDVMEALMGAMLSSNGSDRVFIDGPRGVSAKTFIRNNLCNDELELSFFADCNSWESSLRNILVNKCSFSKARSALGFNTSAAFKLYLTDLYESLKGDLTDMLVIDKIKADIPDHLFTPPNFCSSSLYYTVKFLQRYFDDEGDSGSEYDPDFFDPEEGGDEEIDGLPDNPDEGRGPGGSDQRPGDDEDLVLAGSGHSLDDDHPDPNRPVPKVPKKTKRKLKDRKVALQSRARNLVKQRSTGKSKEKDEMGDREDKPSKALKKEIGGRGGPTRRAYKTATRKTAGLDNSGSGVDKQVKTEGGHPLDVLDKYRAAWLENTPKKQFNEIPSEQEDSPRKKRGGERSREKSPPKAPPANDKATLHQELAAETPMVRLIDREIVNIRQKEADQKRVIAHLDEKLRATSSRHPPATQQAATESNLSRAEQEAQGLIARIHDMNQQNARASRIQTQLSSPERAPRTARLSEQQNISPHFGEADMDFGRAGSQRVLATGSSHRPTAIEEEQVPRHTTSGDRDQMRERLAAGAGADQNPMSSNARDIPRAVFNEPDFTRNQFGRAPHPALIEGARSAIIPVNDTLPGTPAPPQDPGPSIFEDDTETRVPPIQIVDIHVDEPNDGNHIRPPSTSREEEQDGDSESRESPKSDKQ